MAGSSNDGIECAWRMLYPPASLPFLSRWGRPEPLNINLGIGHQHPRSPNWFMTLQSSVLKSEDGDMGGFYVSMCPDRQRHLAARESESIDSDETRHTKCYRILNCTDVVARLFGTPGGKQGSQGARGTKCASAQY
jgi:hypothetical protein